jgi:TolB protein
VARKAIFVTILALMSIVAVSYFGRSSAHVAGPSAGPDVGGKIAYAQNGSIWMYAGGKSEQLTQGPKDRADKQDAQPAWSPDGVTLVYVRYDQGYSDLYKLDIDYREELIALTNLRPKGVEVGQVGVPGVVSGWSDLALWALYPAFSTDGERIAYTSDVGTEYPGLFSINANGKNSVRLGTRLDFSQQTIEHPTWSPDGTRIAVATYVTKGSVGQIWVLNLNTGRWLEITDVPDGAYDPAWSPDGNWIAFTMRQGNSHNIYVAPTDAEQWEGTHPVPIQITTDGASRSPAWSPGGERIAYISRRDDSFDIFSGEITSSSNGQPTLGPVQRLTEKAQIDATSGLSWGP